MKRIYSLAILFCALSLTSKAQVVINEVYGGGGNAGATYKNDFIELYNNGSTAVSLAGWSVQYASATGTTWTNTTPLTGTIAPHSYFLVQEAAGTTTGTYTNLPTPDVTGSINLSGTAGKVALVNNTTALTGACPTGATIIDFVGFGTTANCFEGTGPTTAPSNTTSVQRIFNNATSTAQDTQDNNADFTAGAASPTNSGGGADVTPPTVSTLFPADDAIGVATSFGATITFSEPIQKGTGSITLKKVSDGSTVQSIDVTTSAVTVSGSSASFSITSLQFNTAYYFEVAAGAFKDASNNNFAGISGATTWNFITAATAPVGVLGTTYNFNTCSSPNLPDGFTQYSVQGSIIWDCTTFGRDPNAPAGTTAFPYGVQINGFANGTNVPNIDWFISPSYNLTSTTYPLLSFWSRTAFNGDPLQLRVSTNYSGTGDPNAATWTDLNGKFPNQASDIWTQSANINLSAFKQPNVYFAFVYKSSDDDGARWTLDDIKIDNSSTPPPASITTGTTDIQFTYVAAGSTSDKTFTFTGNDITTAITLTASANFLLSKDGTAFSSSVTYTQVEANNISKTVFVRFAPTQNNQNVTGTVTISTSAISAVINLKGTSIDPANTLEVVNWNLEWFGSADPTLGPSNKALQKQNLQTILPTIGADLYAFVEVVDTAALGTIVRTIMPDYSYIICNYGSHSNPYEAGSSPIGQLQKEAFVYKTSMFKNIDTTSLLSSGVNTAADLSDPDYNSWSSGRYPYMMTADVTLNGITKKIRFIAVHAKANTSPTTTSYNRRKAGADSLHNYLNRIYPGDNIMILGDFNDDLDQSITAGFTTTSWNSFTDDSTNFFSPTLKDLSRTSKKSTVSYNDVIDHVVLSNEMQPYYMPSTASVLTDVAGLVSNYGSTTSDHYPVFTRYSFTVSQFTDYYRTRQSGNWNDMNTWESSPVANFASGLISPATQIPDTAANTITILNSNTVTVTANAKTDQTVINTGGTVNILNSDTLSVYDGAGFDITVNGTLTVQSGGNMTIKSIVSGTASVGNSTGVINGNVTVERYISNRRAWRLLGLPFKTSSQTFKTAWMESAANIDSNPNPGYGTQITTFNGDPNSANYDAVKAASSIRRYSASNSTFNFNSDAFHTPNVNDTILNAQEKAYFLFVRGDRSVDRTITGSASSATTLRASGILQSGVVNRGISNGSFQVVSNPYAASVDFDSIRKQINVSNFYVWDPSLGAIGQYRTINITGTSAPFTYTSTPGSQNNNLRFIESGSAIFIDYNTFPVFFNEGFKSPGSPPSSMLRTLPSQQTELAINLNMVNADNTVSLADGMREVFDNNYSATVDNNDAKKIEGFDLNLGISKGSEVLAIEKRPLPNVNDIIALKLWNTTPGNYQLEVQPANISSQIPAVYLYDNYLNTYTSLDPKATTTNNFTITSDAASAAANRFNIVFSRPSTNTQPAIVIYPNPVQNGFIKLQINNMPKGNYLVKLLNNLGQTILSKQIHHAEGTNTETINVNKITGVYMLEVIKPDNTKIVDKLIIN